MQPEPRPNPPRKRSHRTDWLSLLCGLLFLGIGIRYVAGPLPESVVMLPILIVGLGFAGLVAVIAKAARRR